MGEDSSFIKIGPVGSVNGDAWDEKGHGKIVQIFICHDKGVIHSIQFQYDDENGTRVLSKRHGSNRGGCKFDVVELNYPAEYITWVSGHVTYQYGGYTNLCSITFGTNLGKYGPFGQSKDNDREFSYRMGNSHQFGGFHGTADAYYVKSIGAYLKPITTLYCSVKENVV